MVCDTAVTGTKRKKGSCDAEDGAERLAQKSRRGVGVPTPPPTAIPEHPPWDDEDGYYIFKINEDLTPRYKIMRLLGQGTFGKVVECWDRSTATRVAIKIIRAIPKYREAAKIEVRVLDTIRRWDTPLQESFCIHMLECFEFRNHVCMVFPLLSLSVFDFLRANSFQPFPLAHIRDFAKQLLIATAYLHNLAIIHTDLKPENILLHSNDAYTEDPPTEELKVYAKTRRSKAEQQRQAELVATQQKAKKKTMPKRLKDTTITLIDFGSATFLDEYHSSVVSTRHYRAPEIIFNLGWSFPCDMWSIGCILVELLTGEALFQTHENLEHLKMMEIILGGGWESLLCTGLLHRKQTPPSPKRRRSASMGQALPTWKKYANESKIPAGDVVMAMDAITKYFDDAATVAWPTEETSKKAKAFVRGLKTLEEIIRPEMNEARYDFVDLIRRLLVLDPRQRLTARQALNHHFLTKNYTSLD